VLYNVLVGGITIFLKNDLYMVQAPRFLQGLKYFLSRTKIYLILLAFFSGRASLFEQNYAVGMVFLGLLLYKEMDKYYLWVLITLLGVYSSCNSLLFVMPYLFIIMSMSYLYNRKKLLFKKKQLSFLAFMLGIIVFWKGLYVLIFSPNVFSVLVLVFEALLFVSLTYILIKSFNEDVLKRTNLIYKKNVLAILLILIFLISAFSDIYLWNIYMPGIFSVLFVLYISFCCGPETGSAAGILAGLFFIISGELNAIRIIQLGIGGLFSGIFYTYGKIYSVAAFFSGILVTSFFIQSTEWIVYACIESAAASLVFLLTPEYVLDSFKEFSFFTSGKNLPREKSRKKIQVAVINRLEVFSRTIGELSVDLDGKNNFSIQKKEQKLNSLLNMIVTRVCNGCERKYFCWKNNYHLTMQSFISLFNRIEREDYHGLHNTDKHLKESCIHLQEIITSCAHGIELCRKEDLWKNKINKNHHFLSRQLENISEMVEDLASNLKQDLNKGLHIEERIREKIRVFGFEADEIMVYNSGSNTLEVTVKRAPCGGYKDCANKLSVVISKVVGQTYRCDREVCGYEEEKTECLLKYSPSRELKVGFGTAVNAKQNNISGDRSSCIHLKSNSFLVLLSDGMGTGEEAAYESERVVSLFIKLAEAGYSSKFALRTVNSLLLTRSQERESFATLDLCLVNLQNGKAEFIKVGAAPTYILRKKNVITVRSTSLPVGIIDDIDIKAVEKDLCPGDRLILCTDGVLQPFLNNNNEHQFEKYLKKIDYLDPERAAERILEKSIKTAAGKQAQRDDMTVVVLKVEREDPVGISSAKFKQQGG